MKTKIEFEFNSDNDDIDFEIEALLKARANKIRIDDLYDVVFRPVIKHGNDKKQAVIYQEIWEKVKEHFED